MTDFSFGMDFVIKAENDWPEVRRPQVRIDSSNNSSGTSSSKTGQTKILSVRIESGDGAPPPPAGSGGLAPGGVVPSQKLNTFAYLTVNFVQ